MSATEAARSEQYRQRDAERGALYEVLLAHLETFLASVWTF